jgi:hypothetical protein
VFQKQKFVSDFKVFKGKISKIIFSIIFYFIIIFGYSWLTNEEKGNNIWFLISFIIFLLLFASIGRETYYFKINEDYIIFRNMIWFWVEYKFEISTLRYFRLLDNPRVVQGFRIIDNDFRVFKFSCGSINLDNLKEIEAIIKNKIDVTI